jgi:hypothetical protein
MKRITIILVIMLVYNSASAQSLFVSSVGITSKTKVIVPVINGKQGDQGTDNTTSFAYEHFLKQSKFSILATYVKFKGCILISFEPGGVIAGGGELLSTGFCDGVIVKRADLGLAYLLTKKGKVWYFKSLAAAGLQWARKTGVEFWSDGLPIIGPKYFELEPMRAETMNTTQIVPSIGFKTGFLFWKRLDIGMIVQGVYAFKPYQKMYFKYQYEGVVQPQAEFAASGTGLFVAFGIGYRFHKLIRK